MVSKNKPVFECNQNEIKWNLINNLLAGLLVFFDAFTGAGFHFTLESVIIAGATSLIVALSKFKDYWATQENEYKTKKCCLILLVN